MPPSTGVPGIAIPSTFACILLQRIWMNGMAGRVVMSIVGRSSRAVGRMGNLQVARGTESRSAHHGGPPPGFWASSTQNQYGAWWLSWGYGIRPVAGRVQRRIGGRFAGHPFLHHHESLARAPVGDSAAVQLAPVAGLAVNSACVPASAKNKRAGE